MICVRQGFMAGGNPLCFCSYYKVEYAPKPRTALRGGDWVSDAFLSRAAYRGALAPGNTNYATGFRVAFEIPVPPSGKQSRDKQERSGTD